MDTLKTTKMIKTVVQFALGLLCGYLILLAFNAYQTKAVGIQSDGKTPVLKTVVGY